MDYSLKRLIQLTLALKLALLALIFLVSHLLPFNLQQFAVNFHYPMGEVPDWTSPFKTWDAQHYLFLADQGYAPGAASDAFYPLLPFLIHWTKLLFLDNALFTGLYLSHFFTLLCVVYLYLLVKKTHDEKTAFYSCLFLLAFPTGFYLGLIYSESLFLLLTLAFFYYSREGKVLPAALCAMLLPLSRPTGILVAVPALMDLWMGRDFKSPLFLKKLSLLPAFVLGFAANLVVMKIYAGGYFAYSAAQSVFKSHYSIAHLFHPLGWFIENFIDLHYTWVGYQTGALNRIFFVAVVAALGAAWRHLDKGLFAYALVLGLVPALLGDLMSYMRFAVVLFPLFIFAAIKLKDRPEYFLLAALPIQAFLLAAHALNNWVA